MQLVNLSILLLFCGVGNVQAVRGDDEGSPGRYQHRQLPKNDRQDYYEFSEGRGGVSKAKDIASEMPSETPSTTPSNRPSEKPSVTARPSGSVAPSEPPSASISPSEPPSGLLSASPSEPPSDLPSASPSEPPSGTPSGNPTAAPSKQQSEMPSQQPSERASANPSANPTGFPYDEVSDGPITYTTRESGNWPGDIVFQNELESKLSGGAELIRHFYSNPANAYQDRCNDRVIEDYESVHGGDGLCMTGRGCEFQFCNEDGDDELNMPAYSVKVKTANDISEAIRFAEKYNIAVSVKTSGHNFHGASLMKDSINIWMVHYPVDGGIKGFTDSCGNRFTTMGINGGELWDDVFESLGPDYHILSGDTRSVSAAGGWLQGVGLSHTARMYGLGIDNVVSFDVVLANGDQVTADACSNPDLFWALRGGGGGTFGVVTHVETKVHPKTNFVFVQVEVEDEIGAIRLFLDWWSRTAPFLEKQFAGAWFRATYVEMHIVQDPNLDYANDFINQFEIFVRNELEPAGYSGEFEIESYPSWYEFMGGAAGYQNEREYSRGTSYWVGASSRLIPTNMLIERRSEIVNLLVELYDDYGNWGAYWLGGQVLEVDPDATAVHPVMRSTIFAVTTGRVGANRRMREFFPNGVSGSSFNHQSGTEPEWRTANWGDDHYRRLLGIKNRYDPGRRFNCWHCVGYQGPEFEIY